MKTNSSIVGADAAADLNCRSEAIIHRALLPMVEVEGREHIICRASPSFCKLVGQTEAQLTGKAFAEIIPGGGIDVPLLDRVFRMGAAGNSLQESGPALWIYALWPSVDPSIPPGRFIVQLTKFAGFQQNTALVNEALIISGLHQHGLREAAEAVNAQLKIEVAERKRIEEVLHKAQEELRTEAAALEAMVVDRTWQLRASVGDLEAFSYSLAHDLRAPVRAIHGFTQHVLDMPGQKFAPEAEEYLGRVVKAATRMDSLIQDVLNLRHVIRRPISTETIDVDALVRSLLAERPELSSPGITIEVQGPLLAMIGHEGALSQCVTNLLSNAVKFVATGVRPHIRIRSEILAEPVKCEARSQGRAHVLVAVGRPAVRLWIEDNGIGIDPGAHEAIFEIFQRLNSATAYEGTGIGLAIVRKAIERMGGRVGVESEFGKGSRFWLELPKGHLRD